MKCENHDRKSVCAECADLDAWDTYWLEARMNRPDDYLIGAIQCPQCGASPAMHLPLEIEACARRFNLVNL